MAEQAFTAFYNTQHSFVGISGSLGSIMNSSHDEIIRIYRIGISNESIISTGGILANMLLVLNSNSSLAVTLPATSTSTYSIITPAKHRASNLDLGEIICFNGGIPTGTPKIIRRISWSGFKTIPRTSATFDELECIFQHNIIYDVNPLNTNIQPITLRTGDILTVQNTTSTSPSRITCFIEFTREFI